ncbi:MAG: DOMON-like domain-containing protein [Deltaproteobacteria bacterium]|nr:DOMON-like domain-containing protein [Deltaproteobacteria bacterium]
MNRLSVRYDLFGKISELALAAPQPFPARKDRLWKGTCLELFLALTDSERYWEFNFSPGGDWNVYRFESCRTGMRDETSYSSLPFHVRRETDALRLSVDLDIGLIIPADNSIAAGVAAIVKPVTGETVHWALAHPNSRPDFHRRDGFMLSFSGRSIR